MADHQEEIPEGPHLQPIYCHDEIYQTYKRLITNVAEGLERDNIRTIRSTEDLQTDPQAAALDVLEDLERKGKFSCYNIGPLETLLEDIKRCDLVTKYIEVYKKQYGSAAVQGRHYI